eukprot:6094998-Pyramimonas_sp.AAC.1
MGHPKPRSRSISRPPIKGYSQTLRRSDRDRRRHERCRVDDLRRRHRDSWRCRGGGQKHAPTAARRRHWRRWRSLAATTFGGPSGDR